MTSPKLASLRLETSSAFTRVWMSITAEPILMFTTVTSTRMSKSILIHITLLIFTAIFRMELIRKSA